MKIPRTHIYNYEKMQIERAAFRHTILKIVLLLFILFLIFLSIYIR